MISVGESGLHSGPRLKKECAVSRLARSPLWQQARLMSLCCFTKRTLRGKGKQ